MSQLKNWQELHLFINQDRFYELQLINRFYKNKLKNELIQQERELLGIENVSSSEEIERVDKLRAKRKIRQLCLANQFEFFTTITVNSLNADRYSLEECELQLKKLLNKIKRKNKDFKYIIIIEKHKDGAFHFHGLTADFPEDELYFNDNNYLSCHTLDNLGFNSFLKIQEDYEKNYSYAKVITYITKYIEKDCTKSTGNQLYFRSRNLKNSLRVQLNLSQFNLFFPDFEFDYSDNEFLQKSFYDYDNINDREFIKKLALVSNEVEKFGTEIMNDIILY